MGTAVGRAVPEGCVVGVVVSGRAVGVSVNAGATCTVQAARMVVRMVSKSPVLLFISPLLVWRSNQELLCLDQQHMPLHFLHLLL